ncbi:hypothetical protein BIV57_10720 [Mangrovactinospora gilvigrisea]|uniref:MarR family transcriptional regulator n=1 Tax=Mangrovactinospora gilvigrisea TaxID=1428644 RepID=A0A1J7BVK7_9ACTN|nr:bifunctional helix-turn-helix transcriptional regulator/GNAT family N-acetyltransferase [Mangrovactinospora gilvigrisea]OIV37505.1 hypothetical protein BIV57_10720 [Mangrovactinospora gilvigrisea]
MNAADPRSVARIRDFNRYWTRTIGVLDEGHLHTPYNLSECRVLYEIAAAGSDIGTTVLREALGLDAGQLSRILARFEREKLVTRGPDPDDGRRQTVRLTAAGRRLQDHHDALADAANAELLDRIPERERPEVLAAMDVIRTALDPSAAAGALVIRPPRPGDLGWTVQANAAVYHDQFGWNDDYEALVARIVADYAADHHPRREACWIAELDGRNVGCVFCVGDHGDPTGTTARLRLLLVAPEARGHGVGRRLVEECVRFARDADYTEMVLWTNSVLGSARRIYQAIGFRLEAEEPHVSFGKQLVGQTWRLKLR